MQSTTSVGLSRRSEAEQVTEQRCCVGPISGITVECCVEDVVEQRAVLRPPPPTPAPAGETVQKPN
jgi:hypothetical protein